MKLKNLAVLLIAAVMTVMLYMIGATVFSEEAGADPYEHGGHDGWTELTASNPIESDGRYYLSGKVIRSLDIPGGYNVELCLDHCELDGKITVYSGATLTIYAHSSKGKITAGSDTITINEGGTVNIHGGTIEGTEKPRGSAGENFTITNNGGVLNISDGTTFSSEDYKNKYSIKQTSGVLNVEKGRVDSEQCEISHGIQSSGGEITLTDTVIKNSGYPNIYGINVAGSTTITIKDCVIECEESGVYVNGNANTTANIINTKITGEESGVKIDTGKLNIYGTDTEISGKNRGIFVEKGTKGSAQVNIYGGNIHGNIYAIENRGGTCEVHPDNIEDDKEYGNVTIKGDTCGILIGVYDGGAGNNNPGQVTISQNNDAGCSVEISGDIGIDNSVSGGILTVNGGTVEGTTNGIKIGNSGAKFNLEGGSDISGSSADIYLEENSRITITNELTNSEPYSVYANITVTADFTNTGESEIQKGYNDTEKFVSAMEEFTVRENPENQQLMLYKLTKITFNYNADEYTREGYELIKDKSDDYVLWVGYGEPYGTEKNPLPKPKLVEHSFQGWWYNDQEIKDETLMMQYSPHELVAHWGLGCEHQEHDGDKSDPNWEGWDYENIDDEHHTRTCSLCGHECDSQSGHCDKYGTDHLWVDAGHDKDATCFASGTMKQTCICGANRVVDDPDDPMLEHLPGEWVYYNNDIHVQYCTRDCCKGMSYINSAGHNTDPGSWKDAGEYHQQQCETCYHDGDPYITQEHNYDSEKWKPDPDNEEIHYRECTVSSCHHKDTQKHNTDKDEWKPCTDVEHADSHEQACKDCGYAVREKHVKTACYYINHGDDVHYYDCSVCKAEKIDSDDHIFDRAGTKPEDRKEPTEEEDGYQRMYCECGDYKEVTLVYVRCPHTQHESDSEEDLNWLEEVDGGLVKLWTYTKVNGEVHERRCNLCKEHVCSKDTCGQYGTAHKWGEADDPNESYRPHQTVEPTCTEYGKTRYTCVLCGEIEDREDVEPLGHKDDGGMVYVDQNHHMQSCSRCHKTYGEKISHVFNGDWTDAEDGINHQQRCAICYQDGDPYIKQAHSYEKTTWQPDSDDKTVHSRICDYCDHKDTQKHITDGEWEACDDEEHSDSHVQECSACGAPVYEKHYVDKEDDDPWYHLEEDDGRHYHDCSACGKENAVSGEHIKNPDPSRGMYYGHTDGWYYIDDTDGLHYQNCYVCGMEQLYSEGHTFNIEGTGEGDRQEPTEDADGWHYMYCKCGLRGEKIIDKFIPPETCSTEEPKDPDESDKSDDSSSGGSSSQEPGGPGEGEGGEKDPDETTVTGGTTEPDDPPGGGGEGGGGEKDPDETTVSGGTTDPDEPPGGGDVTSSSSEDPDNPPDNTTSSSEDPDNPPDNTTSSSEDPDNPPDNTTSSSEDPDNPPDNTTSSSEDPDNPPDNTTSSSEDPDNPPDNTTSSSEDPDNPPDNTTSSTKDPNEPPETTQPPGGSTTNPPPGGNDDPGSDFPPSYDESQAGNGTIIIRVEVIGDVAKVGIDGDSMELLREEGLNKQITDEQRETLLSGGKLEIVLTVADLDMTTDNAQWDRQLTRRLIGGLSYNEGVYFDVEILKLLNDQYIGNITRLGSPIRITFEIPKELKQAGRSFSMVRVHEGAAEMLTDWDSNPDTLTIMSDKFSTYAIVYKDSSSGSTDNNPYTGVKHTAGLTMLVLAGAFGTAVFVKQRRK